MYHATDQLSPCILKIEGIVLPRIQRTQRKKYLLSNGGTAPKLWSLDDINISCIALNFLT